MKIRLKNNSIFSIHRRYKHFTLDLPGYAERDVDIPLKHVPDVLTYLKEHHKAVTIAIFGVEKPVEDATESFQVNGAAGSESQSPGTGSGDEGTAEGTGESIAGNQDSGGQQSKQEAPAKPVAFGNGKSGRKSGGKK